MMKFCDVTLSTLSAADKGYSFTFAAPSHHIFKGCVSCRYSGFSINLQQLQCTLMLCYFVTNVLAVIRCESRDGTRLNQCI